MNRGNTHAFRVTVSHDQRQRALSALVIFSIHHPWRDLRSQIYGNQTIKVRAVLGLNMFTISLLVSLRNCLQKFSNGIVNRR